MERKEKKVIAKRDNSLQSLHKARLALKSKYRNLKSVRDKRYSQSRQRYAPITDCLQGLIVRDKNHDSAAASTEHPSRSDDLQGNEEEEAPLSPADAAGPYNSDDEISSENSTIQTYDAKVEQDDDDDPDDDDPDDDDETQMQAGSASIQHETPSARDILRKRLAIKMMMIPGEKNISERETTVLRQYAKSPDGNHKVEENLKRFPVYARPYLRFLTTGDANDFGGGGEIDKVYGPKVSGRSGLMWGNSRLTFDGDKIVLDDTIYPSSEGLFRLIFLKNPSSFTEDDLTVYESMIKQTNVAHHGYSRIRPINNFGGEKFKNIVSKFYQTSKNKKGHGLVDKTSSFKHVSKQLPKVTSNNPNVIVQNLRLALAAVQAGNTVLQKRANYLIEQLEEKGYIRE